MKHLLPQGWERPSGYSNGIQAVGSGVYVAGMIGWNEAGEFPPDFVGQFAQTLKNTVAVLAEAGAGPEHMVRMTWYVKDLDAYRENLLEVGRTYREIMGKNFPAMAVVGVNDLVAREALLEIETTAVIGN
jgi:enamine deaminase RidA (YjgF/YER057c/UK114 family)